MGDIVGTVPKKSAPIRGNLSYSKPLFPTVKGYSQTGNYTSLGGHSSTTPSTRTLVKALSQVEMGERRKKGAMFFVCIKIYTGA